VISSPFDPDLMALAQVEDVLLEFVDSGDRHWSPPPVIFLFVIAIALLASISLEDKEGFYAPEIHRLQGELRQLLPSPAIGEIEWFFHEALALARERAAKSLELRAAVALACLWRDQGKPADARDLIIPVYNWFTEGLDLPDLQRARKVIDSLSRPT